MPGGQRRWLVSAAVGASIGLLWFTEVYGVAHAGTSSRLRIVAFAALLMMLLVILAFAVIRRRTRPLLLSEGERRRRKAKRSQVLGAALTGTFLLWMCALWYGTPRDQWGARMWIYGIYALASLLWSLHGAWRLRRVGDSRSAG
jgi:amino acid transporter